MKRLLLLRSVLASALLAAPLEAQQPSPPVAAPAAPTGPLAEALDAARTTNYAVAEKELAAIQGPQRPVALVALAHVMLEQGRFAEAARDASQAAAAGGGQRLVALALEGEILAAQGKVDEAIKLLSPEKGGPGVGGRRVRLVLGELLVRAGRRADAEPVLLEFANEYGSDAI